MSRFSTDTRIDGGDGRGRGASASPGNRFESVQLSVDGEFMETQRLEGEQPAALPTQVLPDHSRTVINRVDPRKSPDIPFRWTINPYRGCEHGCVYCYARPTHEYLGFNCGLDFETKIMAKLDAPKMLRRELSAPKWRGEPIMMSGVTDPYQPIERKLKITRRILEIFAQHRQPVALITKNRLITRDIDLLSQLAKHQAVHAAVSVTTLDATLAATMEPRASSPADRLRAIMELSDAGVPVAVMVAPILPGLTDTEIPAILKAAAEAGAQSAACVLLRLPWQVKAVYLDWLAHHFPESATRAENLLRQSRNGALYDAGPGVRQRGVGERADQIAKVFCVFAKRFKLDRPLRALKSSYFYKPSSSGQMSLFMDGPHSRD